MHTVLVYHSITSRSDQISDEAISPQRFEQQLRWLSRRRTVVPLIETLHDPEWAVRRQAAMALGEIGPTAQPALRELEKLKHDPHRRVAEAAREAAKKISPRGGSS